MRLAQPLLALALVAGFTGAAHADQKLPPDQQAKVEAMLKQEGFTKWKEIELDDGMIEVDDADRRQRQAVRPEARSEDPRHREAQGRVGRRLRSAASPGHIAGGGLARDVSLANRVRSGRKQP